jgi:hypothetical protein
MNPGKALESRWAPDLLAFGEQLSVTRDRFEAHMAKLLLRARPTLAHQR